MIVEGAPEIGSYYIEYGLDTKKYYGYDDFCCTWYEYWDIPNAPMWQKIYSKEDFSFNRIALKDLRTAIAKHDEFKVGDLVVLNIGRWVYKIDHIYCKAVWLDRGKPQLDIVNIDDVLRHATPSEIKAGHRIDGEMK